MSNIQIEIMVGPGDSLLRAPRENMPRRRKRREGILNLRRNDGTGIMDPVPFVAVMDIILRGRYLEVGRGFVIREEIKEIRRASEQTEASQNGEGLIPA